MRKVYLHVELQTVSDRSHARRTTSAYLHSRPPICEHCSRMPNLLLVCFGPVSILLRSHEVRGLIVSFPELFEAIIASLSHRSGKLLQRSLLLWGVGSGRHAGRRARWGPTERAASGPEAGAAPGALTTPLPRSGPSSARDVGWCTCTPHRQQVCGRTPHAVFRLAFGARHVRRFWAFVLERA